MYDRTRGERDRKARAYGQPDHGEGAAVVGKSTLAEELGPGEPLPAAQRALFEQSLWVDLSDVRIHRDDRAAAFVEALSGRALAVGNDIAFGKDQYDPESPQGQWLLAHEVAHVAQQKQAAPVDRLAPTQPGDRAETDADAAATAMVQGRLASVTRQPMALARKTTAEPLNVPTAASGGTAGAKPDAQTGGEVIGELTAERIGAVPDESADVAPEVPVPSSDGARQELAGAATPTSELDGGAGGADSADGGAAEAPAAPAAPPAEASGAGGELVSEEVGQIQAEVREGAAQAQAEAAAYKAQMQEQRDRYDAEQHAIVIEQLKTMSSTDKRAALADLGFDPKDVKKLKDAELDGLISGTLEAQNRKTKILGMEPEELAALSPERKLQFLVDLGIDRQDLEKAGPAKTAQLFDGVMRAARIPGTHKVKIQVKGGLFGKSWVVEVKCDAEGGVDMQAKKEGSFLSKLVGWIKAALPIVLTVLAPLTGGATLIALSVYQTVVAIQTGNWIGAIVGAAGAVAGVGALAAVAKSTSGLARAVTKIAAIATKVKTAAQTAQAAMLAAKAKSPGSLLAVLAAGAASFAAFAGNAADKFAQTMTRWSERLKKWSTIASGGEKVVKGIQSGDAVAAIGGAFETASAAVGGKTGKSLERAASVTNFVNAGRKALQANPPNYAAVADAALGIAAQLTGERDVESARRIVSAANRLKQAWDARGSNPAALVEAALALAESIQLAKYDHENEEKRDANGNVIADPERAEVVERYQRSTRIVKAAATVLAATTARPRPNYADALAGVTQLVAEFTEDKRIDAAALLQSRIDAWTKAIASGNEQAIFDAGVAVGQAVNGMRSAIEEERAKAKQEAEAKLAPGQQLPAEEVAVLPVGPSFTDLRAPTTTDGQAATPTPTSEPAFDSPADRERDDESEPARAPALAPLTFSQDVYTAQSLLNRLGYSLTVDGLLGPGTRRAFEAFQRHNSLPVTGELDARMLDLIVREVDLKEQRANASPAPTGPTAPTGTSPATPTPQLSPQARQHAELIRGTARALISQLHAARYGQTGSLWHDTISNMVSTFSEEELGELGQKLQEALRLLELTLQGAHATDEGVYRNCENVSRLSAEAVRLLDRYQSNLGTAADIAGGIKWGADVTFKTLAAKYPFIAIPYGALSTGLGALASGAGWKGALAAGFGGGAEFALETIKLDKSGMLDEIALEAAKAIAAEAPKLLVDICQIRSTSAADFIAQARKLLATFCEGVVKRIGARAIVHKFFSRLPATDGLPEKERLVHAWFEEAVTDRLETAIANASDPLFRALEQPR